MDQSIKVFEKRPKAFAKPWVTENVYPTLIWPQYKVEEALLGGFGKGCSVI